MVPSVSDGSLDQKTSTEEVEKNFRAFNSAIDVELGVWYWFQYFSELGGEGQKCCVRYEELSGLITASFCVVIAPEGVDWVSLFLYGGVCVGLATIGACMFRIFLDVLFYVKTLR